jgi:hypothetical protein
MASASSLKTKSYAPAPQFNRELKRWVSGTILLLMLVSFGFVSKYATGALAASAAVLSVSAACALWCLHLGSGVLRWYWTCSLSVLVACQVLPEILQQSAIPGLAWFDALGCGLFVYAMVWVSAMHEREPGLQAVATLALLLSLGVLSKPALAIACALLSTVLFFGNRRRFGGILGSAMLVFTPTVLCSVAIVAVNFLTAGTINGAISHRMGIPALKSMSKQGLPLLTQVAPALWFSLAVLSSRSVERKSGIPDLSYFLVIAFAATAGIASWMPDVLSAIDIRMIVYAGAACLLALNPPQKLSCRVIVLVGASVPLLSQLPFWF